MLRVFGGLSVDGCDFRQPKPLLLVAYLALEGPQSRRHLADLLWPGEPKRLRSLAVALSRLKTHVPNAVAADATTARATIGSDLEAFLAALEVGDLVVAQDVYRGSFLQSLQTREPLPELEDWIYTTREHLAGRAQDAFLRAAEHHAGTGRYREAADLAERACAVRGAAPAEPAFLERAHTLLVADDRSAAAAVEREARTYGLALSATRDAARSRLRQHAPPGGAPAAAERTDGSARRTSFVGRDTELLQLGELLAHPATRLVTVTGTGGTGKTRLALQAAREERDRNLFPGGVHVAMLETLDDAARIPEAIAQALALDGESTPARLASALAGPRTLLVLDNLEHLPGAARALDDLLDRTPNLTLLVTSRETLELEDEQRFPLGGLAFRAPAYPAGGPEDALELDAVRLFVQRARRVRPDFTLDDDTLPAILRICELVEGLPLALEFAAAWMDGLPPADIALELERGLDLLHGTRGARNDRHRSVRAAIAYSWERLDERERGAMRALAVFRGGFTRDAAHEVAGASLYVLASLVRKSLLRMQPCGRYDAHPLVQAYARDRLAERPHEREAAAARHAELFVALAEASEEPLGGPEQAAWLARLDREHDNLRAALHWTVERARTQSALRLAGALQRFWHIHGHLNEGREWYRRVLALRDDGPSDGTDGGPDEAPSARVPRASAERAKALKGAGVLAWMQGALGDASRLLEESLAVSRALGDDLAVARTLNNLGVVAYVQERHHDALQRYEESLRAFRSAGDDAGAATASGNLGLVLYCLGEVAAARRSSLEVLGRFRALGDDWAVVTSLNNLARVEKRLGRRDEAAALLREALELAAAVGAKRVLLDLLEKIAGLNLERCPSSAARLWGAAAAARALLGAPMEPVSRIDYEPDVAAARARLGASFGAAWRTGEALGLDEATEFARDLLDGPELHVAS